MPDLPTWTHHNRVQCRSRLSHSLTRRAPSPPPAGSNASAAESDASPADTTSALDVIKGAAPLDMLREHYQPLRVLGRGASGTVSE